MRFSEKDIQKLAKQGRVRGYKFNDDCSLKNKTEAPGKYKNKKVKVDGHLFDSKKEANRYHELKLLQIAGEITGLKLQEEFKLNVEGVKVASYFADFIYHSAGHLVVEDVKSKATRRIAVYRLKKKLMAAIYKIEIKEV
jgi:hypothetical protein